MKTTSQTPELHPSFSPNSCMEKAKEQKMKPVFIKKLQRNVEMYEDDDLQVNCKASKNLPPVFVEELPFRINLDLDSSIVIDCRRDFNEINAFKVGLQKERDEGSDTDSIVKCRNWNERNGSHYGDKRNLADKPQGPVKLSASQIGRGRVCLYWECPKNSSKIPVDHYLLEMMHEKKDRWEKVSDIPSTAKDCELVNLTSGIKYWFRLSNITLFGQSEPSFLGEPVILKEVKETDIQVPKIPQIVRQKDGKVILKINEYVQNAKNLIIEQREIRGTRFVRTIRFPVNSQSIVLKHLTPGYCYQFRVGLALDGKNIGKFSGYSDAFMWKESYELSLPRFTRHPTNVIISEGSVAMFDCEVVGNPHPNVRWYRGGREIFDGYKNQLLNNNCKLIMKSVQKLEEGNIECRAENEIGSIISQCKLTVNRNTEDTDSEKSDSRQYKILNVKYGQQIRVKLMNNE
ncbi:DgyrCDS13015 [Dimorphilus gyrociliatus]|uniref:DgyrCDS13015 n=1 Tax=Dimorphilus gyrociliatus TaxID=2664684 RepID=A0A7I8W9D4_9ANNE|nr:DgyrCDS13015 [Dimorphilus gyrociliatus]